MGLVSRKILFSYRSVAVLFFLVTSFFAATWGGTHFNSPDETANAFFIRQYVETGSLRVAEPLNVLAEDLLHPRAVAIAHHNLVPGSFLGMLLLYGWIAKILGLWIVPFLTPFFATIASLFFYKLVRAICDERVARWSFFLLLIHPAWIYYTSRSMFPNVLFLSLLIIGLYYLLTTHYSLLTSLLIGAALAVRTSEAGWVLGGIALLWLFHRKEISWKRVVIFIVGVAIAFLPIFYHNNQLYGNPFYNGYAQIDSEAVPAAFAWHFQSRFLSTIFSLLLPFGIKPFVLLQNAYQYLVWFFWWFAVPTVLGFVLIVRKHRSKNVFMFVCLYVCMLLWLVLYYGSWVFHDTTLTGPTLGTSYVRYWLPLFVFGIPFIAFALSKQQRFVMHVTSFCIIILLSSLSVFWNTGESLFALRKTASEGRSVREAVLERTSPSAIILADRSDKLFFPERRVIFNDPLDRRKIDRVMATLRERAPVYYFTELEAHDIDFMNERRLAQYGIRWAGGETIGGEYLYRLEKI